jgi:hypothetical protein
MKNLLLLVFLFSSINAFSQGELNDYKYIIVPKKFDGFKKENQYKTSTLIKYLFTQNGFNTIYDDALPDELNGNRCLGLLVFLDDQSSMFTTKTSLVLKDCASKEIFTTLQGRSKEKNYNEAYNEGLTKAFESIKALDYAYAPNSGQSEPLTVSFKNDVKNVEKTEVKKPKNKKDSVVIEQEATPEKQLYKSKEPVVSKIIKAEPVIEEMAKPSKNDSSILYAQEIQNGFQLVDSTPKIRIRIYKSSMPDYYLAQSDNQNGLVYKKDGKWYFEYYAGDVFQIEELNIKF